MPRKGKLYLIPLPIAENTQDNVIPISVKSCISGLNYFLVENVRTARRFISSLKTDLVIDELKFNVLDKKTSQIHLKKMMKPLLDGKSMGVMSEAGCPGVADPGAAAVEIAHQLGIEVVPLVGPSSLLLALMGSGFNGQCFKFHGYLPIEKESKKNKIRSMEDESRRHDQTQIFMDAPFRNAHLLEDLLETCSQNTEICIARDLTGSQSYIKTKSVRAWKKKKPDVHKIPTIFVMYVSKKR